MSTVNPIPEGYPRLSPYLYVDGASAAIDFYTGVLGATPRGDRMEMPEGRVGHAELTLGDAVIMLADENPAMDIKGPTHFGGTPVMLHVYVEDVDAVFARALAAGAREVRPVADQFYGDRSGMFLDPFGHQWNVASHIEDVSDEEMRRRAAAAMRQE